MSSKKIYLLITITFLANISSTITCMEINHTPQSIINNPLECIRSIRTARETFKQDVVKIKPTLATFQKKYIKHVLRHEHTCPLFLLDECTDVQQKGIIKPCQLSRTNKPCIRESFEKRASELLINKLKTSPDKPITYTGFGCGDILQDLIIITKALTAQPQAQLNIHLIDDSNTTYIWATDFYNYSQEIKADETFIDINSRLSDFAQHIQQQADPNIQTFALEQLQQGLILSCAKKEAQYKQFIKWLTKNFPEAKFSLYIHNIVDTYCNFLTKNNYAHADIVTCADIDDANAYEMASVEDYTSLCFATLHANPAADNLWLLRTNNNHGIFAIAKPRIGLNPIFDCEDL